MDATPQDRIDSGADAPPATAPAETSPAEFATLARSLFETHGVLPTIRGVVGSALTTVPCQWAAAAVTDKLTQHPARLAAMTDPEVMSVVATISAAAGDSPGITAFTTGNAVSCPDLTSDALPPSYRTYAQGILEGTDIKAVLALPLRHAETTVGVMTLYADSAGAFDAAATERAIVLAEHAAIVIEAARADDRADNLEVALVQAQTIGAALGILIERYRLASDMAFAILRNVSQDSNRKIADLAVEIVETGTVHGLDAAAAKVTDPVSPE